MCERSANLDTKTLASNSDQSKPNYFHSEIECLSKPSKSNSYSLSHRNEDNVDSRPEIQLEDLNRTITDDEDDTSYQKQEYKSSTNEEKEVKDSYCNSIQEKCKGLSVLSNDLDSAFNSLSSVEYSIKSLEEDFRLCRGRWKNFESQAFVRGILNYGVNLKMIKDSIPTRTLSQVRSHAQKFFTSLRKRIEDDNLDYSLEEKVRKFYRLSLDMILTLEEAEKILIALTKFNPSHAHKKMKFEIKKQINKTQYNNSNFINTNSEDTYDESTVINLYSMPYSSAEMGVVFQTNKQNQPNFQKQSNSNRMAMFSEVNEKAKEELEQIRKANEYFDQLSQLNLANSQLIQESFKYPLNHMLPNQFLSSNDLFNPYNSSWLNSLINIVNINLVNDQLGYGQVFPTSLMPSNFQHSFSNTMSNNNPQLLNQKRNKDSKPQKIKPPGNKQSCRSDSDCFSNDSTKTGSDYDKQVTWTNPFHLKFDEYDTKKPEESLGKEQIFSSDGGFNFTNIQSDLNIISNSFKNDSSLFNIDYYFHMGN